VEAEEAMVEIGVEEEAEASAVLVAVAQEEVAPAVDGKIELLNHLMHKKWEP
jgi:hypothetical protein